MNLTMTSCSLICHLIAYDLSGPGTSSVVPDANDSDEEFPVERGRLILSEKNNVFRL